MLTDSELVAQLSTFACQPRTVEVESLPPQNEVREKEKAELCPVDRKSENNDKRPHPKACFNDSAVRRVSHAAVLKVARLVASDEKGHIMLSPVV